MWVKWIKEKKLEEDLWFLKFDLTGQWTFWNFGFVHNMRDEREKYQKMSRFGNNSKIILKAAHLWVFLGENIRKANAFESVKSWHRRYFQFFRFWVAESTSKLLKFLLKSDSNFPWLIHSQSLILIPSNFTDLFPIFISICIFSDIILSLPWKEFISIQLSVPASPHFKLCTIKKGFYEHKKIEYAKKCINTLFKIINLKNHRKMHIKNCKMLFVITLK